jgi:hypothetical protein
MGEEAHTATIVKVRAPGHVRRARWATLWLMIFMLGIAIAPIVPFTVDKTGYATAYTKEWLFVVIFIYLTIQFDETARRSSTNMVGFIKDNGLALACIFVGFGAFLAWSFHPTYKLTYDQFHIMLQCMIAAGFDFYYGVIISQRIAFAGKEREEEVTRR